MILTRDEMIKDTIRMLWEAEETKLRIAEEV